MFDSKHLNILIYQRELRFRQVPKVIISTAKIPQYRPLNVVLIIVVSVYDVTVVTSQNDNVGIQFGQPALLLGQTRLERLALFLSWRAWSYRELRFWQFSFVFRLTMFSLTTCIEGLFFSSVILGILSVPFLYLWCISPLTFLSVIFVRLDILLVMFLLPRWLRHLCWRLKHVSGTGFAGFT